MADHRSSTDWTFPLFGSPLCGPPAPDSIVVTVHFKPLLRVWPWNSCPACGMMHGDY